VYEKYQAQDGKRNLILRTARVSKRILESQTTRVQCGGKDCRDPLADARGSVRFYAIMRAKSLCDDEFWA
jgi:hypothetical protein